MMPNDHEMENPSRQKRKKKKLSPKSKQRPKHKKQYYKEWEMNDDDLKGLNKSDSYDNEENAQGDFLQDYF